MIVEYKRPRGLRVTFAEARRLIMKVRVRVLSGPEVVVSAVIVADSHELRQSAIDALVAEGVRKHMHICATRDIKDREITIQFDKA